MYEIMCKLCGGPKRDSDLWSEKGKIDVKKKGIFGGISHKVELVVVQLPIFVWVIFVC